MYPKSMIPWFIENKIDTIAMVFLDKEKIEESYREKFQKQDVIYQTIDGFTAKVVKPKVTGIGLTGVYFDSLRVGSMGKIMLQISGYNLKPKNGDLFLESIRTIKIKEE